MGFGGNLREGRKAGENGEKMKRKTGKGKEKKEPNHYYYYCILLWKRYMGCE